MCAGIIVVVLTRMRSVSGSIRIIFVILEQVTAACTDLYHFCRALHPLCIWAELQLFLEV